MASKVLMLGKGHPFNGINRVGLQLRCFSATCVMRNGGKLVLGCGSNVVDQFFRVQALPKVGEKGFFQSPNNIKEKSIVGGVTLNHLSWASLLGVPTGLLALQGADIPGRLIRNKMNQLNISKDFIQVSDTYTTAQSYVFIQQDGERSIVMASGATSIIKKHIVEEFFEEAVRKNAMMITTEISQVPLSGVIALLRLAKDMGIPSVLDLDVSPSVAMNEAGLGTLEELKKCVMMADILKPAKHAAAEMLEILRPDLSKNAQLSGIDVAKYLRESCNSRLLAMTNGIESSVLTSENHTVEVPTERLKNVVDATGAGDAFLGGLITGLHFHGIPESEDDMRVIGVLANKTGAACCKVLGGLPNDQSREVLKEEILKYRGSIGESESDEAASYNPCPDFENSVNADFEAAQGVLDLMDFRTVAKFIEYLENCKGNVLVSGIGKSAIVAQRMAASLASTGTPAHFVHATEWAHGDLGKIRKEDVVVFFSHSGNTEEVNYAAELVQKHKIPLLSIVGSKDSPLAHMSDAIIDYVVGKDLLEPLGGAPTSSIIMQEMMVNGIIYELIRRRSFTKEQFLWNHPGGSLGRKLSKKLGYNIRFV